jgi:hypothetical protein
MTESAADAFFHSHSSFWPLRDRDIERKLIEQEKSVETEFQSLMTETRGFVSRRNDIAHGIVGGFRARLPPYGPNTYFLSPPNYNTRKYPRSPDGKARTIFETATYHYAADDIDYYREQFHGLQAKMSEFLKRAERLAFHRFQYCEWDDKRVEYGLSDSIQDLRS